MDTSKLRLNNSNCNGIYFSGAISVVLNAPIYMHLYFTPKEPLDIVPAGRMLV